VVVPFVLKTADGRIIFTQADRAEIKYQSLNPAPLFAGVMESARAVILAGGTMSPVSLVLKSLKTLFELFLSDVSY
jgi:chromosome transmission fidelity protein 1